MTKDELNLDSFLNSRHSLVNGTSKGLTQPNFDAQMDWSIINTPRLFDGAVTSIKVGSAAITNAKIGTAAIGSANIQNGAIGNVQIGTAAIGTANIGTLSFNQITGGTATLGGTTNGSGLLVVKNPSGSTTAQIDNTGIIVRDSSTFQFYDSSVPGVVAFMGPSGGNLAVTFNGAGVGFSVPGGSASSNPFFVGSSRLDINGGTTGISNNGANVVIKNAGFTKTAIVPSLKGYKALYCIESPEVWFMDFSPNKSDIDPLFLEVTEGKKYFIKCEDEEGNENYQVWRRRKGFSNDRFKSKTKEQFDKNNKFWMTPIIDNK